MQILAIVIYKGDERRVVRFKLGQLNVLPGWSAKGKSSLLEIAEYCLGRKTPTYAGGLDVVSWFGLLADFGGTTAFFGRPAAAPGAASSTRAMFQQGVTDVPQAGDMTPNTDVGNLRKQLGQLLGIPEDDAAAGVTSLPRATSGQALLFCFQRQGEIANANQLFHRANEDGKPRAIRDALPFFLGAADSDYLADQQRLRDLRAAAREIDRELSQARADASQLSVRAVALINESASVGLLPERSSLQMSEREAIELLRRIEQTETIALDRDPNAAVQERRLRDELQELNLRLRRVQERRGALLALRQERTEFGDEVRVQRNRLLSLQLLPSVRDGAECPVCHSLLEEGDVSTTGLRRAAAELKSRLAGVQALEPERRRAVSALREEQQGLRMRIRAVQGALTNLGAEDVRLDRLQASERRAYVRGKVSQFLQSVLPTEEVQLRMLEERYQQLRAEIQMLDDQLDPSGVAARLSSALGFINGWISEWSEELQLEYTHMRLDPGALTVIADRREGPLPLDRIGSAANAVGYHVVTHAALHRWFVEQDRPVPRFLFLDQPEQAFFPENVAPDARDPSEDFDDDDWTRVRRIYTFLRDLTTDLGGRLQIIVVGHAKLDDEWFEDMMVENWKTPDSGLLPNEWLTVTEAPPDSDDSDSA
jgi:hypothetical protein